MRTLRDLLAALGVVLLVIGITELSSRALLVAVALVAAAWAVHRRFAVFWWIGSALIGLESTGAMRGLIRHPQASLAVTCWVLQLLALALLACRWWSVRQQFSASYHRENDRR